MSSLGKKRSIWAGRQRNGEKDRARMKRRLTRSREAAQLGERGLETAGARQSSASIMARVDGGGARLTRDPAVSWGKRRRRRAKASGHSGARGPTVVWGERRWR